MGAASTSIQEALLQHGLLGVANLVFGGVIVYLHRRHDALQTKVNEEKQALNDKRIEEHKAVLAAIQQNTEAMRELTRAVDQRKK